ncbi:MAG: DNA photolyase family protein [Alphaproteobacteria bacterium]|nr:DNA photolyase family protein [Alphaproteobacteria bacterium]
MPPAPTSASAAPVLVWFRQDLRVADNPALAAAAQTGAPVVCLYLLDDETPGPWRMGGASRWWLHHSLEALDADLRRLGGGLILRRGPAAAVVPALAAEIGAGAVYWNRCYEPFAVARDTALKAALQADGRAVRSFNSALLFEPWDVRNGSGEAFKVYSPFWRAALKKGPSRSLAATPARLPAPAKPVPSDALGSWRLLPTKPDWAGGLRAAWTPGEAGAKARFDAFCERTLQGYAADRNIPGRVTTSALSPHLHFGEISPLQIWSAVEARGLAGKDADKFVSELGWREFSHHLLFDFPDLPDRNWRTQFDDFPWADDPAGIEAWKRGRTGYPIVDAGMRELWTTGWMHNRVRMVVASFLIKHLMTDWRVGQDWFWDTLVDADLANNAASWQWVAGSGADAAPYFRIFNPVSQGETYDPDGAYVRRWVPEIARLPNALLHRPWEADAAALRAAGVTLGETYPRPIIDHATARARALAAFEHLPKRG